MSGQDYGQTRGRYQERLGTMRSANHSTSRHLAYGRSCMRCKVYFVTSDPEVFTCQWCQKVESGGMLGVEFDPVESEAAWSQEVRSADA